MDSAALSGPGSGLLVLRRPWRNIRRHWPGSSRLSHNGLPPPRRLGLRSGRPGVFGKRTSLPNLSSEAGRTSGGRNDELHWLASASGRLARPGAISVGPIHSFRPRSEHTLAGVYESRKYPARSEDARWGVSCVGNPRPQPQCTTQPRLLGLLRVTRPRQKSARTNDVPPGV